MPMFAAPAVPNEGGGSEQQELEQRLNVGSSGHVRELQPLASAASPSASSEDALLEVTRRRVLMLAAVLAVLAIFHNFADYFAEVAEIEQAVAEIREVAPKSWQKDLDKFPNAASLLKSHEHKVILHVVISLAIPLCGYLGVKQGDRSLMCCFCGCNLLFALSSLLFVSLATLGLTVISVGVPKLEAWLDMCNPSQCLGLADQKHTIDCLAGEERTRSYEGIPHLDIDCLQALSCEDVDKTDACMSPGINPEGVSNCKDPLRRHFCAQKSVAYHCEMHGRCHWLQLPQSPTGFCIPTGLPLDPVTACKVDKDKVQDFDAIAKFAPLVAGNIMTLLMVKIALTLPTVVIGGLGFHYGKVLYDRLNAGYGYLGGGGLPSAPGGGGVRPPQPESHAVDEDLSSTTSSNMAGV